MTKDEDRALVDAINTDPDFQREMADASARQDAAETECVFAGVTLGGKRIAPPGPSVWRWLEAAKSPLAPGGDFSTLCDADLVLALAIICRGRAAIDDLLSLPIRQRRSDDPESLADAAAVVCVEAAYAYAEKEFGPAVAGIQPIADAVVQLLKANAPASVKKN
jgi:hypothetical protein